MNRFFNRLATNDVYDWESLRQNAPRETGLFQSVLNTKDDVEQYLQIPRKIYQEEIDAALFVAHTMDNTDAVRKIFPYASTSGVEAGKLCLIGSTYINNLDLFNDTVVWLKKHGENALKKKDIRNHCLTNFSSFNNVDKVKEILKANKGTLKNESAVNDFCASVASPAARYGSLELFELGVGVRKDYGKTNDNMYASTFLIHGLTLLSSVYPSKDGAERVLETPAHNEVFEWILSNHDARYFNSFLQHSMYNKMNTNRLIDVLKLYDENDIQKFMEAFTSHRHLPNNHLQQAYEQLCSLRQKEVLNSHINSTASSSTARKM